MPRHYGLIFQLLVFSLLILRSRNGGIAEYRQAPIKKSGYHASLEDQDEGNPTEDIRYWSDFNRVYYVPRTVQKIPDAPDWESTDIDWNTGQDLFSHYNEVRRSPLLPT